MGTSFCIVKGGGIFLEKNFLEIGKIVAPHGLSGEVRVAPWCDDCDFLCGFKKLYFDEKGEKKVEILSAKTHKNVVRMKIAGVDSVDQAELMRGKILFMSRDDVDLPEGRFFIQDVLGLAVWDADNNVCYGKVTDVLKTGANDVYQVTDSRGKDYLIPAIEDVVCAIDVKNKTMKIRPLKGIFDDED